MNTWLNHANHWVVDKDCHLCIEPMTKEQEAYYARLLRELEDERATEAKKTSKIRSQNSGTFSFGTFTLPTTDETQSTTQTES